jgi:ABC-2 type transport system permease protein
MDKPTEKQKRILQDFSRFRLRVYLEFSKKSFQKRMQYRVANLAGLTTNFFFAAVRIFVFAAFYEAQTTPQPLNLNEVTTYVCLTQAFLMVMPLFWGRSEITESIKDGSVALQLCKPIDFYGYWFADEVGKSVYYIIMRGVPTFALSKILFDIWIPLDPALIVSFIASIALTVALSAALTIAVLGTVFWTLDATGIAGFVSTLVMFFSGFLVPISLWPEWLQSVAAWLPFEGVAHLPFSIYLGKISGAEVFTTLAKQMMWFFVFFGAGRLVLRFGFSRVVVQGG